MDVAHKHPEITVGRRDDWLLCRSSYNGESTIKAQGERFLPKPSGYSKAGGHADGGTAAYGAYKKRAQFSDIMSVSIGAMVGIIHQREIAIELPSALEYLHENVNGRRMSMSDFHKRITRELLIMGRYGVLADAPSGGGDPFLSGYNAETIINWDEDGGDFYVLDESDNERTGFYWTYVEKYRVLQMIEGRYQQELHKGGSSEDITPTSRGGNVIQRIPFVVASAKDIGPDVESPPLAGVARAALAMYQLSADYRLQLYMSGQETLVAINGDAPRAVGAGVVHEMFGSEGLEPDLKYVSPSCSGIQAHLEAIEANKETAVQSGARMFEQSKNTQESGNARQLRFQSETANLLSVAQVSCSLLERALRNAAVMAGANEDEVIVKTPTDLLEHAISAQDVKAFWELVVDGGMSWQTFYERSQKGGVMSSERTAEEEYALIEGDITDRDAEV